MTCGPFSPSRLNRGSYFPGPQELKTALVGASSAGDRATMAPTLRSRLGQPSSRLPTPGAKELSTVEWHRAQVMPSRISVSVPPTVSTVPLTPTTALSFSRATVVAGSVRLTVPDWMPATTAAGRASESTFRPTAKAASLIPRLPQAMTPATRTKRRPALTCWGRERNAGRTEDLHAERDDAMVILHSNRVAARGPPAGRFSTTAAWREPDRSRLHA